MEKGMDVTYDENAMEEQGKKLRNRHSPQQIFMLEQCFKCCPHPSKNQIQQLSKDLDLEPKQIKFWFQNRRSQSKVHKQRITNNALKAENEILRRQNLQMAEALKNVKCPACSSADSEVQTLQHLMLENAWMNNEIERLRRIMVPYMVVHEDSQSASFPTGNNTFTARD